MKFEGFLRNENKWISGGRVSNAWATCPVLEDSIGKLVVILHKLTVRHLKVRKDLSVQEGPASD